MLAIDHRIRPRTLFGKMNYRIRFKCLHRGRKKVVVGPGAHGHLNRVPRQLLPHLQPFGKRTDRGEGLRAEFMVPLTAEEVVNDCDGVPLAREIQSRSPTAIPVAPKNCNPHILFSSSAFEAFCPAESASPPIRTPTLA